VVSPERNDDVTEPSFDLNSQDFKKNPFPTFARLRDTGPIVRVKLPLVGSIWIVTTYESVTTMLRDRENFVMEAQRIGRSRLPGLLNWLPQSFRALSKNMLTTDEPDHRRLRGLVEQAFLRQSVEEMRDRLELLADRQLDHLESKAHESNGTVDLIEHFARPFPLSVISELLGLPDGDRPKFTKFANRLTKATSVATMFAAMPGVWSLTRYFRRQFESCRKNPRPGLISALVAAEQDGQRLTEDELVAMSYLLLLAGHETTVHLLGTGVLALLQHPVQLQKLQGDWSKASAAVDESLRYMSPIQVTKPRYAVRNLELYGQHVKRGDIVMALLASANSDPEEFRNPEEFDVDRVPNRHVGFGTGIHVCLGLKLARAEGAIAYEKLFTRFPDAKLAIPATDLLWTKRIGMRAPSTLPLVLGSRHD